MSSSSDDDEDYAYGDNTNQEVKRYPVHDACELEDAEALQRLIFVAQQEESDNDEDNVDEEEGQEERRQGDDSASSSSSSDDNDSTAAAHAAAIGHSPRPIRPTVEIPASAESKGSVSTTAGVDTAMSESNGGPAAEATTPSKAANEAAAEAASILAASSAAETAGEGTPMETSPGGNAPTNNDYQQQQEEKQTTPTKDKASNGGDSQLAKGSSNEKKQKKQKFFCPHNLNERDADENTPIHVAIHARKLEHVKLLLEAGANVHKKSDGSAPIHTTISIAALQQNEQFGYDCLVLLNNFEADLTAKDDAMHTPLYLACMFNLPSIVTYLLANEAGMSTLNSKADRSGGRPLHAAAKFDTSSKPFGSRSAASAANAARPTAPIHHPDGSVANNLHQIPGFPGKVAEHVGGKQAPSAAVAAPSAGLSPEAMLTQLLLRTEGIEVDALNTVGQTPLHIACLRGNWVVARLLVQAEADPNIADRRGFTPGQLAHKRGMPIPVDLINPLGGPPSSGTVAPPRDLIVDPNGNTMLISHELCVLHRSCVPITRDAAEEPPPENVRRLTVLIDEDTGILRGSEFGRCVWEGEARRAAMIDVLKCHEYSYVEKISNLCSSIPDHPNAITHLDADTAVSRWSFESALRAAGSVCEAVDKVVAGDFRNAFCAVRPPGHHAGPRGIVKCDNDPEGGSHGFCLLNNVAIGAAYARSMYRNEGIRKIAIIDFDVHHGNGTEEIIRKLVPNVEKSTVRTPFAVGELASVSYSPWLDETDLNDVFFASTHGYGARGLEFADVPGQGGWFYPASGQTHISDAIANPSMVEAPSLQDFISSQAWTRMGEDSRANCCKILNCGLGLPNRDAVPGMQRLELRDAYRKKILPHLREFDPDIIFVSAGFDAHKKDTMNFGYVGMVEDDYEWVTEQLVKIANTCCNGRIVSVLEGGYKIHGGIVSPFARSVASHVRGLVDGGTSRELYDPQDVEWESQFERHLVDERERKRQQKIEKLRQISEHSARSMFEATSGGVGEEIPEDPDAPSRKRRRNQVDYRNLYEQMKKEGFAG